MNKPLRKEDFAQEELDKCKASPVYFYNKYVRKEGMNEVTEEEYADIVRDAELIRNGLPASWKLRNRYKQPLTPNDCFKK